MFQEPNTISIGSVQDTISIGSVQDCNQDVTDDNDVENEKLTDAKALEFDANETEENVTDVNDVEFGETAKNDR